MRNKGFLTAFLLFSALPLFTQEQLVLQPETGFYRLGGLLYMLEDPDGSLEIDDVRRLSDAFVRYEGNEPNIGFSASVYWVRFQVKNNTENEQWFFEVAYPPLDTVELFFPGASAEQYRVMVSGDTVPYAERPFPHRNHLFPLALSSEESAVYYLRIDSDSSIVIPVNIWEREQFFNRDSRNQMLLGLFFGILIVMVLYNVPITVSTGELTYVYYIFFVISNLFFQLGFTGVGVVYLWPKNPWWAQYSLTLFGSLSVTFAILFTMSFLQTKKWAPRLHPLLMGFFIISLLNSCLSLFIAYSITIQVTNYLLILVSAVSVITAVYIYKKGYTPARYYFLAWIFLFSAVFIVGFKNLGLLPSNEFTSSVLQIGTALEVILLSIALADKITHLRISREKAEQEKLLHQEIALQATEEKLYKDSLTGFPNRNSLIRDIKQQEQSALFLINIDHFKEVNDFYGNLIGDQLLKLLGARLHDIVLAYHSVAYRLHADEFAVLIHRPLSREELDAVGKEIYLHSQEKPYSIDDRLIRLELSIGIASGVKDNLLEKADMALSQSREQQQHYCIYDSSMATRKQYENNLKWIDIIRESIACDRVVPYFQPIFCNRTKNIEKYESLMRIRDGSGKVVGPRSFLSIAKKAKLYPELSRLMIGKCFAICENIDREITINLSVDDLNSAETLEEIVRLAERPEARGKIVFEILESEGIKNYENISLFIKKMQNKGIKIALDDFGTGYSNFDHILRLEVDYIKIDASLIKNIHRDRLSRSIVETILDLSKRLNVKSVAEYVHSSDVFLAVNELGIDYSQGYYIGEPSPDLVQEVNLRED